MQDTLAVSLDQLPITQSHVVENNPSTMLLALFIGFFPSVTLAILLVCISDSFVVADFLSRDLKNLIVSPAVAYFTWYLGEIT